MRSRQFELNFENGQLTVKQQGLYLLYSQVVSDINHFIMYLTQTNSLKEFKIIFDNIFTTK